MIKESGTTPNFHINSKELKNSCCCESFLDLCDSITIRERTTFLPYAQDYYKLGIGVLLFIFFSL